MKLIYTVLSVILITACSNTDEELKTDVQKFSYAVGHQLGTKLKSDDLQLNPSVLSQAVRDALEGAKPKIDAEQMQAAVAKERTRIEAGHNKISEQNQAKGDEYLAANKEKDGVKLTDSGLQYKVIKQAEGKKPAQTDTVMVHYRGSLIGGEEFDSSYKRNKPATFPLNAVIPGWTEGLQLMSVGSKYEFTIPGNLAYGARGGGAKIGPNEVLVFEVELLEIK